MNRKKGFTLIEIMIVLSIIGLLSIILVPKVGVIKLQSKNNSVSTNVILVRTYLENRCAKDSSAYKTAVNGNQTKDQALTVILKNIETDMDSNFSGSNSLINPFNNSKSITKDLSGNSSVLLSYSPNALPKDNDEIANNSTLPAGENVKGNVVIIVYGSSGDKVGGYALYGIDSDGKIVNPYIIKFKASTVINENTNTDSDIETNVNKVANYIKIDAIRKIIMGVPESKIYNVIQGPLYHDLRSKFTPGDASNHIVNLYYLNKDMIYDDGYHNYEDGYHDIKNEEFSIIVNANPSDYSNIDSKYSDHPGTVVAYVSNNPMGYVVYGVDKSGKTVYKTPINLSTEVTPEMKAVLGNNVNSVASILKNNLAANVKLAKDKCPYDTWGRATELQSLAKNQLQQLNLKNSYIPDWTGIRTDTNNFDKDNGTSLVIEHTPGNYVTDYKGTVIVDVLSDASGYDIYGVDYTGSKYTGSNDDYIEVK